MFRDEIIQQIKNIWDNHQSFGSMAEVPELEIYDLQVLIETTFFASLRKEESESINFSIAFISREEIDRLHAKHGKIQVVLKFERPLFFDPDSITKLANAFDKNTTALAVGSFVNELGRKYIIGGALFYGPPGGRV